MSPKVERLIKQLYNSGGTAGLTLADMLETIASNGEGQEQDDFLVVCAEELRDEAQGFIDAMGREE